MKLTVINNQYEDSVVQLVGEGYEDDITLDNIHSVLRTIDPEQEEGSMAEDDVSGKGLSVCLSVCHGGGCISLWVQVGAPGGVSASRSGGCTPPDTHPTLDTHTHTHTLDTPTP